MARSGLRSLPRNVTDVTRVLSRLDGAAAIAAILGGEEQIGRKLLDMTSTDYAAEECGSRTAEGEPATPRPLKRAE